VIAEGHGWFLRRYDRTRALQFIAMVESMRPLKVCSIGTKEQHGSYEMLRKFADQNLTLADAMGLHVMNDLKIRSCWSTDFHLGLTGVPLVINAY
jgi:predicted nucleic acid-binding protein